MIVRFSTVGGLLSRLKAERTSAKASKLKNALRRWPRSRSRPPTHWSTPSIRKQVLLSTKCLN